MSRIEGGSFFKIWFSPWRRAHSFTRFTRVSRIPLVNVPGMVSAAVPRMAFWHDSGSSRRNKQVDPWQSREQCFGMLQTLQTVDFRRGSSLSVDEP
eukprot:4458568-Pyramimonas_sp.AAC.1